MFKQHLLVSIALTALLSPAVAAEFYIVQDTATKRCQIDEQKPTSITLVVVADKVSQRAQKPKTLSSRLRRADEARRIPLVQQRNSLSNWSSTPMCGLPRQTCIRSRTC
jgi:hypothetical protein